MKKLIALLISFNYLVACSGGGGGANSNNNVNPSPTGAAAYVTPAPLGVNVLPVTVSCGYMNEPCVTVTVCKPGTASCVTINNILLDTGSSGLRVFDSTVSALNLSTVLNGSSREVAKITNYADGTCQWGPVKVADVKMGGETASSVNIQIINASYKTVPAGCTNAENDPVQAQYNGILGVGTRDYDCGTACVGTTNNKLYYSCSTTTSSCIYSTAQLAEQVRNPVAALTSASAGDTIDDSNGSMLVLPSIPETGSVSASGYLVLGVGTRANNTPSVNATVFSTDQDGFFYTNYNGHSNYDAFIDSGSNGYYIPPSSQTPVCSSSSSFYCPSSTVDLQATQVAYTGGTTKLINFSIVNAYAAFNSANYATNIGGYLQDSSGTYYFDWGLPFFFGRSVYTGIYGKSSTINGVTYSPMPFYAY